MRPTISPLTRRVMVKLSDVSRDFLPYDTHTGSGSRVLRTTPRFFQVKSTDSWLNISHKIMFCFSGIFPTKIVRVTFFDSIHFQLLFLGKRKNDRSLRSVGKGRQRSFQAKRSWKRVSEQVQEVRVVILIEGIPMYTRKSARFTSR